MDVEMLRRIEAGVGKMLAWQTEAEQSLARLRAGGDIATQLVSFDTGLKELKTFTTDIEQRLAKLRDSGVGAVRESDTLFNVMADDLRKWIPRVRASVGGVGAMAAGAGLSSSFARAIDRLKVADPVLYVACGGYFQARIKSALAHKHGQYEKVKQWNERADKLFDALGGVEATTKAALQEDTASEGGNLVPTIVEAVIGWLMKEASIVRGAGATVMQMTTKTHALPKLDTDFTLTWHSEEGTITDAVPATPFSQPTLTAKRIDGLVTVSIELLQDNIVNLMDFVMVHLLQQYGRAEDTQALEGDGTVFTGLFAASGTNSVAGGSNALSEDELRKLIYGGEHQATLDNGVIFAHPWVMRDAIGLAISSGTPWFSTVFGVDQQGNARPKNIWGVPAFVSSVVARNRGAGTNETTVYHGNPQYIIIGDRMATTFDFNPWSETEFKKGQVLMRFMRRVGIVIWVPAYFTKLTAVTVAA